MKNKIVITYGTFDCIHYGHIRLLQRAKSLGNYLIVGVTSDDFDKSRGKVNVQQSLMERIEGVRNTGLADKIIVEEYEGQKIDDIKRYDVTTFTVGSDWKGKFDYLKKYCEVIYLDRTEGISSSEIRSKRRNTAIGFLGGTQKNIFNKYLKECRFVNGADISGMCIDGYKGNEPKGVRLFDDYSELLGASDAVFIDSMPSQHYQDIKKALMSNKHVLCESPLALKKTECEELLELAKSKECILMEAIKTAYSTAYSRLLLLVQSGAIGRVVSINATCTSLLSKKQMENSYTWDSICEWGPTALLPVFQVFGIDDFETRFTTFRRDGSKFDYFTKIDINYPFATATVNVANGIKAEGDLVISGDQAYIYVPAPWWKTDYFELRKENRNDKRYFYQLEGEGIRYELVMFLRAIENGKNYSYIESGVSVAIAEVMENYYSNQNLISMM